MSPFYRWEAGLIQATLTDNFILVLEGKPSFFHYSVNTVASVIYISLFE